MAKYKDTADPLNYCFPCVKALTFCTSGLRQQLLPPPSLYHNNDAFYEPKIYFLERSKSDNELFVLTLSRQTNHRESHEECKLSTLLSPSFWASYVHIYKPGATMVCLFSSQLNINIIPIIFFIIMMINFGLVLSITK